MKLRMRWKGIAGIGAVVAGFAVLLFLTPARDAQVNFSALKPLPAGDATTVPFSTGELTIFFNELLQRL